MLKLGVRDDAFVRAASEFSSVVKSGNAQSFCFDILSAVNIRRFELRPRETSARDNLFRLRADRFRSAQTYGSKHFSLGALEHRVNRDLRRFQVTKNKTWKDIAGMLGIGASSSAAYTLRKHYTKNLLAYECHFDRGGIDPQPIINQVEATTKKKSNKNNSVPSPG